MVKLLCQICLRSGFERTEDIDEKLIDLHEEICDYDAFTNPKLSYCSICEYKLRKFYNFKQKCKRANKILKIKKAGSRSKNFACENLHELMPPDSISFSTKEDRQAIINCVPVLTSHITFQNQSGEHFLVVFDENDQPTSETVKHELRTVEHTLGTVENPLGTVENPLRTVENPLGTIENPLGTIENILGTVENPLVTVEHTDTELPGIIDTIKVETDAEDPMIIVNDTENTEFKQEPVDIEESKYDFLINSDFENVEFLNSDSDDEKLISKYVNGMKNDTDVKKESKTKTKAFKKKALKRELLYKFDSDKDYSDDEVISAITTDKSNNITLSVIDGLGFEELKLLKKTLPKSDRKIIQIQKKILELKNRTVWLIENGKIDLGDDVTMTKEIFLDMFEKCDKNRLLNRGLLKYGPGGMEKLKKFLLYLLKRFNPSYETVFETQHLLTQEMKLAEFNSRKHYKEYLSAEFKCERCYKGFEGKKILDYHINTWHEETRPYGCNICPMRFTARKQLSKHLQSNHDSVFRCKLCSMVTYDFFSMVNHHDQHKGMKYTCDICLGEYKSKSARNTHMLAHATHRCAICARRFVSQFGLHKHVLQKHQGARAGSGAGVSCDTCRAVFETRDALRRHRLRHKPNPDIFKCRHKGCSIHFESAAELRQHAIEAGHGGSRGPPGPGKFWGARGQGPARVRVNVCGPDKPYRKCTTCGEQVANTSSNALYKHHVEAHPALPYARVDELNYLCDSCGKAFLDAGTFYDHLNTHAGVKPYACPQCSARFAMKRALYAHSERHRPPRHECSRCGKKFRSAANLFSHMRTHIGDRKFKCDICSKGFLHAGSLAEHVKGVHNQIRRVKKTKRK